VQRKISGPKRGEVKGERRRLHNEELNGVYFLPDIIRLIKSRRMRWAEHVARRRREEVLTGVWWVV